MVKKRRKAYKFRGLSQSVDGMISSILGMVSLGLTIAEMIITVQMRGAAGGAAGYMGFAALILSVVGFVFAIMSWKDQETEDVSKRIGTLLNGFMIVVSVVLLILGILNWN